MHARYLKEPSRMSRRSTPDPVAHACILAGPLRPRAHGVSSWRIVASSALRWARQLESVAQRPAPSLHAHRQAPSRPATCPYRARGPSATRAAPPFCRGVKDARLRGRSLHQATEPRERGCCAKTNTFASGGPPSVFPPFSGGHSSYRKRIGLSRSRY